MKNISHKILILTFAVNTSCVQSNTVGSRLQSGVPATASVTLRAGPESSGDLQFVHNKDVDGKDNYALSQLTITIATGSGKVNLDPSSNQVALPPLMFAVKLSATDGRRKLSCEAAQMSLGTLPISCLLDGGAGSASELNSKGADQEIANYIKTQKETISSALYFVETNVLNSKIPQDVAIRWQQLERDVKPSGGLYGATDAIASSIRGWNVGLDYEAESVAYVLSGVYSSDSGSQGGPPGVPSPFVGPPKPKTCYCIYGIYSDENDDGSIQGSKEESRGFISESECMKHLDGKMYPLSWDSFYRYDTCSMR